MIEWLGLRNQDKNMLECAREIDIAVSEVLNELKDVTSDLGGTASTEKMGDAICQKLQAR